MQEKITQSTFTHVAYYAGGYTWESTIEKRPGSLLPQSGVIQTRGLKAAPLYREPTRDLTTAEVDGLVRYGQVQIWIGRRYNIAELVADVLIVPTRKFWEWLGWIPFGNNSHGAVCSAFVAKAFVYGALIPVFAEIECADRIPGTLRYIRFGKTQEGRDVPKLSWYWALIALGLGFLAAWCGRGILASRAAAAELAAANGRYLAAQSGLDSSLGIGSAIESERGAALVQSGHTTNAIQSGASSVGAGSTAIAGSGAIIATDLSSTPSDADKLDQLAVILERDQSIVGSLQK